MKPLVVVDADVLGRRRTGDETYVEQLLEALPRVEHRLRLGAITRRPDLVPRGITPLELRARFQETRMAIGVPRLLRRVKPDLVHFVHALPPSLDCPGVLTVADLSFERDPALMRWRERMIFRSVVPWSVRRAARVIAVSERTKQDLLDLYGLEPDRVVVIPHGADPVFRPGARSDSYLLFVGAIEARKNPLAALAAAEQVGLPLVVAGPERDRRLVRALVERGADVRGFVSKDELAELYRGAAVFVFPTRYEGFGLPVLEAMASGTPVVAAPDAAVREVAGDAVAYAEPDELATAVERVLADRERLVAAGLERAQTFSWEEAARRTVDVYRE